MFDFEKLSNSDLELLETIRKEFFTISEITIDPDIEGLRIKNDIMILGCQAGPSQELSNLFHEMGHLVVCPDDKIGQSSWGLEYKNWVHIQGYAPFAEPTTCQDVMLELKVIGWQAIIEKHYTESMDGALDNVRALSFLNGWSYYQYRTTKGLAYGERDKEKVRIGQQWVKDFVEKNTFSDFKKEWNRKLEVISKGVMV